MKITPQNIVTESQERGLTVPYALTDAVTNQEEIQFAIDQLDKYGTAWKLIRDKKGLVVYVEEVVHMTYESVHHRHNQRTDYQ